MKFYNGEVITCLGGGVTKAFRDFCMNSYNEKHSCIRCLKKHGWQGSINKNGVIEVLSGVILVLKEEESVYDK